MRKTFLSAVLALLVLGFSFMPTADASWRGGRGYYRGYYGGPYVGAYYYPGYSSYYYPGYPAYYYPGGYYTYWRYRIFGGNKS